MEKEEICSIINMSSIPRTDLMLIFVLGEDQCGYVSTTDERFVMVFSSLGPIWILNLFVLEIRKSAIDS